MRVYLTTTELNNDVGSQLLELCLQITEDGKVDLQEILTLRKWLSLNKTNKSIAGIPYLVDIMQRITADGVIDRDERVELHLAIERVIPAALRVPSVQARKKREVAKREAIRLHKQIEKDKFKQERIDAIAQRNRIRHSFANVAGVTFPNDDHSERQVIISQCQIGEWLTLPHDAYNEYSVFATKVLRMNGQQLGHAPEYLAERIVEEAESEFNSVGMITDLTGGTFDKPSRGVNFAIFFTDNSVSRDELWSYAAKILAARH